MFTSFPTSARGRSRLSKPLPKPPDDKSPSMEDNAALPPALLQSALPPLPQERTSNVIPRRPIGSQAKHPKTPSVSSLSSGDSDIPRSSRSLSNGSSYNTKDSLSEPDSIPPLPPKNNHGSQILPSSPKVLASPISSLHSSPPRPEIWKRRSVRSEKNISLPELKLDKSNGSTASPPRKQAQPARAQIPRSIAGRKPVPARPAPKQPDLMGNKLAKLKNKNLGESSAETSNDEALNHNTPFKRLLIPEYLKTDKPQPLTPKGLSSTSPATPPEEQAPEVPLKSEFRPNVTPVPVSLDSTNSPNLAPHSREPTEALTITSEPALMRSPQPKKAFAAKILTPQASPDKTSPRVPSSPLSPPAGLGTHFPTLQSNAEKGAVFLGPALDVIHLDCYQSHKFMRSSRNRLCPVACMICQKKDVEMRWKCTWCCLSACGSCMRVLSSIPGKDLRECLERIGK